MIPLIVTATTPHGIALARPWGPPLDALLASVLWDRTKWAARAAGTHMTYQPDDEPETLDLPLARCGRGDTWHWMATCADLHGPIDDPDIRWRTATTDRDRMHQLTCPTGNVIRERSGRYQRRRIPVMVHCATTVTWRAVGDPDRIYALLTELSAIGKHRGVGEGRVSNWSVAAAPELPRWDAGHLHEPGVLGRAAPLRCLKHVPGLQTGPVGTTSIRPPYMHQGTRVTAGTPAPLTMKTEP